MGNIDICSKINNKNTNPLSSCFFSMPPKQYALLSSLLGILFVENLDTDQQNSLGNFFVSVGSSMLAAAAQAQLIESNRYATASK